MRLTTPAMDDRKLFVSFKIAEVCNLVCNYCYFFFNGDESYKEHPAVISPKTVEAVARFLGEGARDLGIRTVEIAMHGGEPLMVGKKRFARYCEILSEGISPFAQLNLGVQTNGVLLDEEWLTILSKFDLRLGISIDGPQHVHDAARVDKKGRGSHAQVVNAFRLAQSAASASIIAEPPSASIVIRPATSAREIYNHIVHELGVKRMDFLPPRDHWDSHSPEVTKFIEGYSLELMNCWLEDDNPQVNIRTMKHILAPFLTDLAVDIRTNYLADLIEAITIRSNGDVSADDTLPALGEEFRHTGCNVSRSTLREFYSHSLWDDIRRTVTAPPDDCAKCQWLGFCGGGDVVTRFSGARRFDNPTIYCGRNKILYKRAREYVTKYVDHAIVDERMRRSRDVMFHAA